VSKRDDDSQADMEVGMTTAERRRRRRRGGGLRVPSDNVPRRANPPVAPVPEDPSLAMSIAYSFSTDADAAPRTGRDGVPTYEADAMPTVIDPVSGPIEQADFEMQTREMSAVDLEALGLSEAAMSGHGLPIHRITSPGMGRVTGGPPDLGVQVRFKKRDQTDPVVIDDLDVDFDGMAEGARTLEQPIHRDDTEHGGDDAAEVEDVDDDDVDAVDDDGERDDTASDGTAMDGGFEPPAPQAPTPPYAPPLQYVATPAPQPHTPPPLQYAAMPAPQPHTPPPQYAAMPAPQPHTPPPQYAPPPQQHQSPDPLRRVPFGDTSQPRTVLPDAPPRIGRPPAPLAGQKAMRAQTVALSEEDLEEVREAARLASHLSPRQGSSSIPPPMPSAKPADARPRVARPPSVPEIDLAALEVREAGGSGEFEVDVEGIVDARSAPIALLTPAAAPVAPAAAASQPGGNAEPRGGHASGGGPPPVTAPSQRESQPIPVMREPGAPPPPPVVHNKAPPAPPPAKKERPAAASARPDSKSDGKPGRGKSWFVDLFDEDYLRTLPFLTPQATQAEAEFVIDAMGLTPGAQVLDVGCGYGRHAMELAARGFHVVGLDTSTPLLVRGGEEAHRRGLTINFVRGDMRELDFDAQFDGAYCLFSTFGYFDDETNKKTVANIARALKPGGRVLIEILNRDYVIADLPTRVWWEGDGCVVLEEVELNYFSSRIQVNRSVVFDDGRQVEQEISVRAYSLHEVGKLLHSAGFRVLEVSGAYHTRGRFFGNQSRHIIVLAERKEPAAS